jgi:ribosomal protein S18 acetylase RimI-like enzyme
MVGMPPAPGGPRLRCIGRRSLRGGRKIVPGGTDERKQERGVPMNQGPVKIRLMQADDFDAVVEIDAKVLKVARPAYYELKFEKLFKSKDYLPTSLVAQAQDGTVMGFIMGELYMGEYGIFQEEARLDTIGVDPDHRHKGIGEQLMNEFVDHLRQIGVKKVNTLVDWNDSELIHFFSANRFTPSKTIYLERSL